MSLRMRNFWGNYGPLLSAPLQQRRHTGELWVWLTLLLIALVLVLGVAIAVDTSAAAKVLGFVTLSVLVIGWCICFDGLRQQNHPHMARLVPGHVARLRRCAVGLMLSVSLGVAGVFGAATGSPLLWGLGAGAVLLALAVCVRWVWLWLPLTILPLLGFWAPVEPLLQSLWAGLRHWYLTQPASLGLLAALLLPWLLSRLLQEGGATHRRSYRQQADLRQLMAGPASANTAKPMGDIGRAFAQLFAWPFAPWREHLLRAAKPEARSALARAELVSLGSLHWSCILGGLSVVWIILALLAGWVQLRYAPDWSELGRNGSVGLQIGFVCAALNPLLGLAANLYRSRREQALLMLLPGMPKGRVLNRLMGQRMLLQFYLQWGFALAVVAAVVSLGGREHFSRLGLYALLAVLPMGGWLLRDWSRQPMPSGVRIALPLLAGLLGTGLVFGLAWAGIGLGWLAAASLLLSVGLLAWRWPRYVLSSPSAMPVGRWA
ncbi:hypothetical protein [Roseateles sp.]|uniref:hypothetical protein n=1 Tax=Roseateles sp. TaxID=1971397 RepID=UPI00286B4745|nr:hypothetical protein [Roseateles sp.]